MKFSTTATREQQRRVFTAGAATQLKFTAAAAPAAGTKPKSIGTLSGYALTWNTLSDDRGGYKVRLAPNSATFNAQTFALWHHDYAKPLASTENGTLRILPDEFGVKVEMDVADTQAGRDTVELVERKDVQGMSFGMIDVLEWTENSENDVTIVTFTKYGVDEVTVTAIPAFTSTSIEVQVKPEGEGYGAKRYAADAARLDQLRLASYGRV